MTDAVIVATARTPIGRAYRGAFNDTQAQALGGHAIAQAVQRAGVDPAEIDRKLAELRSVENWLKMNLAFLQMTVKTLEMQKSVVSQALRDLEAIRAYIAFDSTLYADLTVRRVVAAVERLKAFPESVARVTPVPADIQCKVAQAFQ